jgi:hypothetical protein
VAKRILVGLFVLLATGCYSYVPVELEVAPVGQDVRVYLSRTGVERLRELGGDQIPGAAADQPVVSGTLVRRTGSDFSLLIPVTSRQVGFLQTDLGQQVTFPAADAVQVQLRKVSALKTGLVVAGSTALIGYVIVNIVQGARQPVDRPIPEPGDLRFPARFSIP